MNHDICDVIGEATLADLDQLVALEREFPEADRISRRSWRRFLSTPGSVMVCRRDALVSAAAVLLFRSGSRKARLYSIAVGRDARGQGFGHALLEACEQAALRHGCQSLTLEVRVSNAGAINLYRKHGFIKTGLLEHYYDDGEDALHMAKALENGQTSR